MTLDGGFIRHPFDVRQDMQSSPRLRVNEMLCLSSVHKLYMMPDAIPPERTREKPFEAFSLKILPFETAISQV